MAPIGEGLRSGDLITVFGGSGFVGRHVVRLLAQRGYRVRVAVRRPNEALFLKPMGDVGQVQPVQANVRDTASCQAALAGASAVINLVGILSESGRQNFDAVHADAAARLASLAADAGISRFVQMSALGADENSASDYARTKAQGENAVRAEIPTAAIVRPSIIFGQEDEFFNRFANLARLSPVVPLVGGGETRYQPVYVEDVAEAIVALVEDSEPSGRTVELGGAETYSFRELMELMLDETARTNALVPVPFAVASLMTFALRWWFIPADLRLTPDQIKLLQVDNTVSEGSEGLADLGIEPTALMSILPAYLYRYRRHGQFEAA